MLLLLYAAGLFLCVLVLSLILIYARAFLSPLRHIPGRALTRPFFGTFIEYVHLEKGMLEYTLADKKKYGVLRTAFMFFGRRKVLVSDPHWIKVSSCVAARKERRQQRKVTSVIAILQSVSFCTLPACHCVNLN